jgi:hypothetical protein
MNYLFKLNEMIILVLEKKITHFGISDSILRSLPNVFNTITFPIKENMHIKLTVNKYTPNLIYFMI